MKYIKHIILTAFAMVMMMTGTWAMDIYIHYENGTWPTGISSSYFNDAGDLIIDVEPTDVMGAVKTKIQEKTGFVVSGMQLSFASYGNLDDNISFAGYNIQKWSTLTLQYTAPVDPSVPVKQANGAWKFTMPDANKLMEVEYYTPYTLTLSHNAGHGTVELLRPGSSATVGNAENAFQYCYDCQRSPAYPTVANNGNNNLYGFTNPYVGLNGVGVTNDPSGPWKLEYVGKYSHSEYNFSVSSVRHTYGLNSDEDVPIFLLYQWSSATNQYEPVVYGVACAYSKLNNTHGDDHTLLFVGEGHWGCFLSNNQHSQNLNISFDEDLSAGMHDFAEAATPALPDGVVDNHDGTYSVTPGTTVTIEAIANTAEYYYFDNWTNENANEYAAGVVTPSGDRPATSLLTFVVTGDTTVRGNFKIDTYTLRVKTNNTGMGHVGIGETVYTSEYKDTVMTYHQHIDVTAIPDPGYYFVNWTNENGVEVSTSITLNWMATADTILTANFAAYATLQVASNNTAWGTVGEPQVSAGNTDHVMTLYDESESTSNHMVPAYTCWFDASTKSQYVIPASKMADAKGGTISSIQYYTQDPVSWISGVVDVYLKEVTDPTLSSMEDKSSCTVVYHGQLTFENGGVTITFTNPYPYNGGNLLVGLENEAAGYNCGIQFLGEDAPGASMSGFVGNYQQQDFLPQCTFTYQPSGVKVNPNGGYYIIPGSDVTVTATPETNYQFANWNDQNTDNPRTITVTSDTTFTAIFGLPDPGLTNPGLTPEGEITLQGGRFLNEHGQIVGQPRVTEHGEFIDYSGGATVTVPDGAINGKFTINADGNQVYFSQGNLQASNNTANSATGWIWSFAEHQYDYIGNNGANDKINGAMTISEAGIIDLFSWNGNSSTSGDHYGIFSMDNNSYFGNMHPETLKNDWGHNAISNGGNTADMWRTLTKDEWVYVFNNRNTASGVRYARANVNGCKGVILLPDDWNTSYYTLNNTNQEPTNYSADNYSANTISLSDWENSLESHGAVFLPAAGSRAYGNANSIILSSFNSAGNYWSSSSYSSDRAYSVYFSNTDSQLSKNSYRKPGFSVRLVMDVE